jgi:uncharacterized sulfatase
MPQPNFVLIMTDTQGANMVGAYGRPELQTPNIDRLAADGVRFERAYTTCPLCTPARAALFSGMYAHTSGPWTNNLALGSNIINMGQRFEDASYHTAYIGKWHLDGHDYFGTGNCPLGWDSDFWYDGRNYLNDMSAEEIHLWRRGLGTLADLRAHSIRPEFTWAHRVTNRAEQFLRYNALDVLREPFLLVVSYDEPHHPFTCPPQYAQRFEHYDYPVGPAAFDTLEDKPAHQHEWAASTPKPAVPGVLRHPLYFGCNSFVDAEIGRVVDAARRYSPRNTYIIYTSDHGDMMTAHGLTGKGPVMYDEITRIPLIISQPSLAGAGRVAHTPVSHIDLLPTMLQLAGMKVPPILEGTSIVSQLSGHEQLDRAVAMEFNRYEIEHDSWGGFQPVRCMLAGQHKLVLNLLSTDELYDLQADPHELRNLIDDPASAAVRDQLHDQLLAWMNAKRDPFRGPAWERRSWRSTRRLQWRGMFRARPADGYAPDVRDYDTGLPAVGVKVEFGKQK